MLRRVRDWLEDRSGLGALAASFGNDVLPGGARWGRTFGAATIAFIVLEAITGMGLAAWYAPTMQDAWASVHFIQFKLSLGWLLRGLHHVGGNVLIVLAVLHLLSAVAWAAYRKPRELLWVTGVVILLLLIVVSHTGYLLPQDLRAYNATQVLVGIAGNQPVIGPPGQLLIQGGNNVGNATLTHLYALHVLVGPALLVAVLGLHLHLRKRHGAPTPWLVTPEQAQATAQPYAPDQLWRDLFVTLVALVGTLLFVWKEGGVELGSPGDPAVDYVARPEWYMLPIFQLRHWFTGSTEFVATVILPGVATTGLAGLPWIAAKLEQRAARWHVMVTTGVVVGLAATVALGAVIVIEDGAKPEVAKSNAAADRLAKEAQRLAMIGVPLEGPLHLYKNDPVVWGEKVFVRDCQACHTPCDQKPFEGVLCLEGYASRTWLTKFMKAPAAPHFFGNTKIDSMDPWSGDDATLKAIVEFLIAESGRENTDATLVTLGKTAYEDEGCGSCHTLDGKGNGDAPDLLGWASPPWLEAFIRTPGAHRFYGKVNEMDDFPHEKLSKDELMSVIAYLRAQTDGQSKYP